MIICGYKGVFIDFIGSHVVAIKCMELRERKIVQDLDQHNFNTPIKQVRKVLSASSVKSKEKEKERTSRTPSGQVLNTSVKDIRNFFAQSYSNLAMHEKANHSTEANAQEFDSHGDSRPGSPALEPEEWNIVKGAKSTKQTAKGHLKPRLFEDKRNSANQNKHEVNQLFDKTLKTGLVNGLYNRFSFLQQDDQSSLDQSSIEEEMAIGTTSKDVLQAIIPAVENSEKSLDINKTCNQEHLTEVIEGLNTALQKEGGESLIDTVIGKSQEHTGKNPQVMDVQLVMKMFKEIKRDFAEMKKNTATNASTLEVQRQKEIQEITELKQEVSEYKHKTDILSSLIENMGNLYLDLEGKMNRMELKGYRKSVVLSGLKSEDKIPSSLKAVREMFCKLKEALKEKIIITDCFRI